MKRIILFAAISICIFALMGCGKASEKSNTAENKNPPVANPAPSKAAAKTALKPGDISPDKAVSVDDLVDAVVADPTGWKGKEVAVIGYVYSTSSSGGKGLLSLQSSKEDNKKDLSCGLKGDVPEGVFDKTVEVKGSIKFLPASTDERKVVNLEPCELKK